MARRKDPLGDYAAKREFAATPEPAPGLARRSDGPLLFVVQLHSATRLHYDFRLECDGVLLSWAVPKGPSLDPDEKRLAVAVEPHPFDYASFEGVIPPGQYGAGEVIVWDCGVYSPDEGGVWYDDRDEAQRQVRAGYRAGKLSVLLRGEKLKGSFALVRTKGDGSWLLIKHRDRFAAAGDVTERSRSVLSGAAVEEMVKVPAHRIDTAELVPSGPAAAMPERLEPMLAEPGERPFRKPDWLWEPKLDGYRALAFVDDRGVRLRSRRGLELAPVFPRLAEELAAQWRPAPRPPAGAAKPRARRAPAASAGHEGMILDGELVAFDAAGRPSFQALQNRARLEGERAIAAADRSVPLAFFCFDLLYFAGVDLRGSPYRHRRRYLSQCLLPSPLVQLVHAEDDGVALLEAALASGFEGVVGKRLDSVYRSGRRSAAWIKVKPTRTADFVIGGYTRGKGAREPLGALLVGYRENRRLRFASHVGSGFDRRTLAALRKRLKPLERAVCPFAEEPELPNPTTWVEPRLVAEVQFHSWTDDGRLRAPVFLRLRDDLDPRSVKRRAARRAPGRAGGEAPRASGLVAEVLAQLDEERRAPVLAVGPHRVKLTHVDRVYWPADESLRQPALTKRDLLRYFAQVSPYLLPHLADRPLTMIRMPDGIRGQRFYQKHWEQARPEFVETVDVFSSSKEENHQYLMCNNLPTLLWLAQSGALELHVWHSRARPGPDCAVKGTDYARSLESLEASVLNYPDYVVFDVDPYIYSGREAPGSEPELNTVAFEKGKEVAFRLRELLRSMSLEPLVKTSGKTGLHLFVPIRRSLDFDAARHVSELVGRHLVRLYPREVTMDWSVPKRTGKIFLDHNMNVRGKTLNVAYSPRGLPGAPVSMPLSWERLGSAHPLDFRVDNAMEHLAKRGDCWQNPQSRKQSLEGALAGAGS
jgi:bifunctional non-homologous end joining protein LigD